MTEKISEENNCIKSISMVSSLGDILIDFHNYIYKKKNNI